MSQDNSSTIKVGDRVLVKFSESLDNGRVGIVIRSGPKMSVLRCEDGIWKTQGVRGYTGEPLGPVEQLVVRNIHIESSEEHASAL